jgi:hypothetical protein
MKNSDAILSQDRLYRYLLTRIWDENKPMINFIGLNPSTADEIEDDPTTRRCIAFAKSWGYGGFYLTNLFAFISEKPEELKKVEDPIGKENDIYLLDTAKKVEEVIFAWGTKGKFLSRDKHVMNLITKGYYIALTKNGHPSHPLYLKSGLRIKKF